MSAGLLAVAAHPHLAPAVVMDGAAPPASTLVNATTSYTLTAHTQQRNERLTTTVFTFPANTDVSGVSVATVSGQDITNGAAIPILGVATDNAAGTVTITTSYRRNQLRTDFTFTVGGVVNASHPGAYAYSVALTTNQNTRVATGGYALAPNSTAVTVGAATLSTDTVGVPVACSAPFTVGPTGRLAGTTAAGGNTVTVVFPAGYTLPTSAPASSVTLDGVAAAAVSIGGNAVTVTLPSGMTIPAGSTATVAFDLAFGLVNPAAGSYSLGVRTSAQTGIGSSPPFAVVFVPYLTISIDTTSIDFGVAEPGVTLGPVSINVEVGCNLPVTLSREVAGDASLMGLVVTGGADGTKPAGLATYLDLCTLTAPWSTDPGIPLLATITYTAVL